MVTISVCIGSACHLKGAYNVISALQKEMERLNIEGKVELKASFCLGHCTNPVSVKIDDGPVLSLKAEGVSAFLEEHVLKKL